MKCIIIEDEIPAQRILKNYIAKLPDMELISSFQSALAANSMLQSQAVDLIFLDINLPDISGLQYIKTLASPPAVVMTTAYHEHAVESFELDTICDYLVKPFSFERFLKAVNKVKKHMGTNIAATVSETSVESFFLNIDKTLHKIDVGSILYIESDKNYVTVVTDQGRFSYLDSLKNWLQKLPDALFVQIHKSYIANCAKITRMQGNLVYLGTEKLPVGRVYKNTLKKKLKLK